MTGIAGLTNPFFGGKASVYVHTAGYTFRWVKGDRYVAVMRGTCVDARRVIIVRDLLAGHRVLETPQPLVDAVAIAPDGWYDPGALRGGAKRWVTSRAGRRPVRDRAEVGSCRTRSVGSEPSRRS